MAGNPFKKYGLTVEGYNRLAAAQNGRCKICNELPRPRKRLVVDHDHKTGAVRGLLCGHCNSGIGFFRDNTGWLSSAITYLNVADPLKTDTGFDVVEFLVLNQRRVKSFGIDANGKLSAATFFPEDVTQEDQAPSQPAVRDTSPKDQPLNDADLALSPPADMLIPPPAEEQN